VRFGVSRLPGPAAAETESSARYGADASSATIPSGFPSGGLKVKEK
jgi:hypothetical protein